MELAEIIRTLPGYDPYRNADEYVFSEDAAQFRLGFIRKHIKFSAGTDAGKPFKLEQWQVAILANLFGWVRKDDPKVRRFNKVLCYVPRKNGKGPLAALIANVILFTEAESGAELYCCASDQKQAMLVFKHITAMQQFDKSLRTRVHTLKSYKTITHQDTGATVRAIPAEAGGSHGYCSKVVIFDELHAQPNREFVDAMRTSLASMAFSNLLEVDLTTADFAREGSICNETYHYACKVRDGVIDDPHYLPAIYEAGRDDDWTSPEVWAKANPNLGVSVSMAYIASECKKAKEIPSYENTFKRLHLNIITEQAERWLALSDWDKGSEPIDLRSLEGEICCGGLDLASKRDSTAFVLAFGDRDRGVTVVPFFWLPESIVTKEAGRMDAEQYRLWSQQGFVELTPGNVTDYGYVRRRINELRERFRLRTVWHDPYNALQLSLQLAEEDGIEMIPLDQNSRRMHDPCMTFESLVVDGKLRHGGHPVLREHAANVAIRRDSADMMRTDKPNSVGRIDGIVAAIMACEALLRSTDDDDGFVYNSRGVIGV